MINLEKLNYNTMDNFKELHSRSSQFNSYNKDFFKHYEQQGIINKYLFRKFVKLIKYRDITIGFIWHEAPLDSIIKVWSLFIDERYENYINEETLREYNYAVLNYEVIDNPRNNIMLKSLGFKKGGPTYLMKSRISGYNLNSLENTDDITFKMFIPGVDEGLRCDIQNRIFLNQNRIPLTVEDIYVDINQDYYIGDLAVFILYKGKFAGYGQVIYTRNMYTIVNFGTISKYRGMGLGKHLLNHLIGIAKVKGIKELCLRVDKENKNAIELYSWADFKIIETISKWERF